MINIWSKTQKTIIFITHSIPEAVYLGDRVAVMRPLQDNLEDIINSKSLNPEQSSIKEIIDIDLPKPRCLEIRDTNEFKTYCKLLRQKLKSENG